MIMKICARICVSCVEFQRSSEAFGGCVGRYRRMRPIVSFALATGMIIVLALWLTGILQIQVDLAPIDNNPTAVLVALVMSLLAALLLYEW
jgi:hypothetical protein